MGFEEGIWETLLREADRKNRLPDTTLLLLGPKGSGKSALAQALSQASGSQALGTAEGEDNVQGDHSSFHPVLAYTVIDATDPSESTLDRDDEPAKINVWGCSDMEFMGLLNDVLVPSKLSQTMALVVVDLTQTPDQIVQQAEVWISAVETHVTQNKPIETDTGSQNVVGMAVVGCKVGEENAKTDTFEGQELLMEVQQRLRSLCLEMGAALAFVNAVDGTNCELLLRYILQQLHPTSFAFDITARVDACTFIPVGWDSPALIESLGTKSRHEESTNMNRNVGVVHDKRRESVQDIDTIEPEDVWLKELSRLSNLNVPTPRIGSSATSGTFTANLQSPGVTGGTSTSTFSGSSTADGSPAPADKKNIRNFFEGLMAGNIPVATKK